MAYSGNVLRVYNAQTSVPECDVASMTRDMRLSMHLPIEYRNVEVKTGIDLSEVVNRMKSTDDVGAGAMLVMSDKLPIMMFSPDQRWGILNVLPLMADKPSGEKFRKRFSKAYWNVIARTLGAGTSSYPGCVVMPFSNHKELDAITATRPCPEPFNKMIDTAARYGIGMLKINTYRRACEEGWAPAPTNNVQKAIWDEVHAMPTAPIKIKPETKKVRE